MVASLMTGSFKPVPFDPLHDAALLIALGYTMTHYPESYEDIGDPESGPRLVGDPAFDHWMLDDHVIIVCDEEVVEAGIDPFAAAFRRLQEEQAREVAQ